MGTSKSSQPAYVSPLRVRADPRTRYVKRTHKEALEKTHLKLVLEASVAVSRVEPVHQNPEPPLHFPVCECRGLVPKYHVPSTPSVMS